MGEPANKIVTYTRFIVLLRYALIGIIFTLASILLMLIGFRIKLWNISITIKEGYSYELIALIAILGFLISFPITLYYTYRILIRKPSLIINEYGILDRATFTSAGFIPWSEITSVCIRTGGYRSYVQFTLGISLKNKEEFISRRFQGIKKVLIKMGKYPVNIPQWSINMNIRKAFDIISYYINLQQEGRTNGDYQS